MTGEFGDWASEGIAVKKVGSTGTKTPPKPLSSHAEIDEWLGRQMPDLQPILKRLDKAIRRAIDKPHAIKWQKAYYGSPDLGWIIEMVSYDVSVNLVFLGGANFDDPPPDGTGTSRYVKLKSVEEAEALEVLEWIEEAARTRGWN